MPRHPPLALSSLSIKLDQTNKILNYCNPHISTIRFPCGGGRLPTGAPNHLDTKDLFLLYYSIIKDQFTSRTNVLKSIFKISLKVTLQPVDGGGERDRTDGLLRARQALSQLSYTPIRCQISEDRSQNNEALAPLIICPLSSGA